MSFCFFFGHKLKWKNRREVPVVKMKIFLREDSIFWALVDRGGERLGGGAFGVDFAFMFFIFLFSFFHFLSQKKFLFSFYLFQK